MTTHSVPIAEQAARLVVIQPSRGLVSLQLRALQLAQEAVGGYQAVLAQSPAMATAHRNLGGLYAQAAEAERGAQRISRTTGLTTDALPFLLAVPGPSGGYTAAAEELLAAAVAKRPGDRVAAWFLEQMASAE